MSIIDFFIPKNIKHIQAYKHLQKTGSWPEGFLPNNIYIPNNWQFVLQDMIAQCWIDYISCKAVIGDSNV